MAFKRQGNSNSRYGSKGGHNPSGKNGGKKSFGNKSGGYSKPVDPNVGYVNMGEFTPEEYERGKKYPTFTGYFNITREALKAWLKLPINKEYNNVENLRISIWEDPDSGRFTGKVAFYKDPDADDDDEEDEEESDEEDDEEEVVQEDDEVVAPVVTKAKATSAKAKARKLMDTPELDDIPF